MKMTNTNLVNKHDKVKNTRVWGSIVDWLIDKLMKNENQIVAEVQSYIAFTNQILGKR